MSDLDLTSDNSTRNSARPTGFSGLGIWESTDKAAPVCLLGSLMTLSSPVPANLASVRPKHTTVHNSVFENCPEKRQRSWAALFGLELARPLADVAVWRCFTLLQTVL